MTVRTKIHRAVPIGALPDFTPVPRKVQRHDGWTPERQRAFIAALADTGCVAIACRMVNMSQPSYYQLRRQPGAESFRAAADAAQTLGLQVVKDEAFDRAMNGELIPVFVGGKLMGFRRKKNDRLLMFILRHYGQDAGGRRTTINYFSTRASAGAAAAENSPLPLGEREGPAAKRWEGEGTPTALAAAESSTTTVKTVISGTDAPDQRAADDEAAAILNAFEGVALDAEAQDQIHRALAACAERRRALDEDPESDRERLYIGAAETSGYLGELESGVEGDWLDCHPEGWQRPEGEHLWENLGEGGEAERIDQVLAEMAARRAKQSACPEPVEKPEAIAAERTEAAKDEAEAEADIPVSPRHRGSEAPAAAKAGRRPPRRNKKRQPKPPFTPPTACPGPRSVEARKAEAVAAVKAERRKLADAEAERRRRRKSGGSSGDS